MNIPKYIDRLINRRAELAKDLNTVDCELTKWLDAHKILIEDYDYMGGCEMFVNPDDSAKRVKDAITAK